MKRCNTCKTFAYAMEELRVRKCEVWKCPECKEVKIILEYVD